METARQSNFRACDCPKNVFWGVRMLKLRCLRNFLRDEALIVTAICWSAAVIAGVLYGIFTL